MAEAERITGTPETGPDSEPGTAAVPGAGGKAGGTAPRERDEHRDETLDEDEAGATSARAKGRGKRRIGTLFLVAAVVYLLDLGSKALVVAKLEHHAPIEVIGSLLRLEVIRNRGAAFSIGEALTIFLTIIAAIVIVVIIRIARKLYSLPWGIALGLLLGGAFGNLTDRIFRTPGVFEGAVVDFIAPAHFAVFNLADSAIVCGGILIVILSFRGLDPDGTVHKD
ncbi:lipoprotein signal peptidase [Streptomyces chrestomyceticus JCM 4735]|uniref:Lipoprotein signal peptidase n=1 Tax=Streptomyces chrestomyceticus JCM 4735 TaxID=1306181 RepID=A0A7U9KZN4_9ACTN|nr:signal peptidase II [Streptomyces chrestomyceticus]GCD38367.1 lipoprotein signal peptidase [Streptomyces chrestomyceticus JCM 4735]